MKWDHVSMRAWTPNTGTCWPTKWVANAPLVTPTCSLQCTKWKDGQKLEIPCSQRLPWLEDQMLPDHRHWRTSFPQSAIVESIGTEGDWTVVLEGEEEVESSEGDPETPSEIGGTDQPLRCIVWFANTVELYQKKNQNCFGCGSSVHLVKDCPKDLSKVTRKVSLNAKEGMMKKECCTPQKPVVTQLTSQDRAPRD